MGLNFKEWVRQKIGGEGRQISSREVSGEEFFHLSAEIHIRELAFWACVNLMGNAVSKCEFKTFIGGKETKGAEYYLWNYSPNKNQNSSAFLHKWIAKMYQENEALVVEHDGQLLVADSFCHTEYALLDDVFTQVTIGDFQFRRSFTQSEVLYIKLSEKNMRDVINGLYRSYQVLIEYGMKSYRKSRGSKGTLELDTAVAGNSRYNEALENLQNKGFKSFAEAENALLTLYKGMNYKELGNKTYSNESTRDIRAMIDDVSDFTAKGFGIPPALLSGEVAGTADCLDQLLTFGVDPLVDMLQEEINRKRNGFDGISRGTYLQIDTRNIRHMDIMKAPAEIEKLISSGVYCVNDIRLIMGDSIINEDWAWQHFISKNFGEIKETLDSAKGGEI